MSNALSVRRVKFQDLHEDGTPDGPATFGVIGSDSYGQEFVNSYETFEELNKAIEEAGCIVDLINDNDAFPGADREKIGTDNFYGKDWETEDEEDEDEDDLEEDEE